MASKSRFAVSKVQSAGGFLFQIRKPPFSESRFASFGVIQMFTLTSASSE